MGAQRATLVSPPQRAAAQTSAGLLGPPPANRINSTDSPPVRRISAQEARERRSKEISLHAIIGATYPQTFWVKGKIQNIEVTTLIDGGSTHNFMDQTLVKRLGLSMDQGNKLPVMVANGDRIECVGKCMGLTLTVQNCPVQSNFYVLPVAACPIVLGVQWLETLGPIETDYRQLTMKFKLGDRLYQLQGIQRASISALEVSDLCGVEQVACFLLTTEVDTLCERESSLEELEQLLEEFQRVFDTPSGLPPPRGHDHTIPLLPNQPSVSVRPYRYPYYQKSEIEAMVKEFLDAGIIRPSNSPFSSPVLLVKKSNGSWRFCVDFRALNKITIKDKYPIPVIDELLNELHGSKFFTKLDL
nr:uncharacterized protein LOC125422982 [Ziziphus jujuba var. spinosa]